MKQQPSPWSIKGIDPDTRQLAKEAAKEAGMTLGEWLNNRIRLEIEEAAATKNKSIANPADNSDSDNTTQSKSETPPNSGELVEAEENSSTASVTIQPSSSPLPLPTTTVQTTPAPSQDTPPIVNAIRDLANRIRDNEEKNTAAFESLRADMNNSLRRVDTISSEFRALNHNIARDREDTQRLRVETRTTANTLAKIKEDSADFTKTLHQSVARTVAEQLKTLPPSRPDLDFVKNQTVEIQKVASQAIDTYIKSLPQPIANALTEEQVEATITAAQERTNAEIEEYKQVFNEVASHLEVSQQWMEENKEAVQNAIGALTEQMEELSHKSDSTAKSFGHAVGVISQRVDELSAEQTLLRTTLEHNKALPEATTIDSPENYAPAAVQPPIPTQKEGDIYEETDSSYNDDDNNDHHEHEHQSAEDVFSDDEPDADDTDTATLLEPEIYDNTPQDQSGRNQQQDQDQHDNYGHHAYEHEHESLSPQHEDDNLPYQETNFLNSDLAQNNTYNDALIHEQTNSTHQTEEVPYDTPVHDNTQADVTVQDQDATKNNNFLIDEPEYSDTGIEQQPATSAPASPSETNETLDRLHALEARLNDQHITDTQIADNQRTNDTNDISSMASELRQRLNMHKNKNAPDNTGNAKQQQEIQTSPALSSSVSHDTDEQEKPTVYDNETIEDVFDATEIAETPEERAVLESLNSPRTPPKSNMIIDDLLPEPYDDDDNSNLNVQSYRSTTKDGSGSFLKKLGGMFGSRRKTMTAKKSNDSSINDDDDFSSFDMHDEDNNNMLYDNDRYDNPVDYNDNVDDIDNFNDTPYKQPGHTPRKELSKKLVLTGVFVGSIVMGAAGYSLLS